MLVFISECDDEAQARFQGVGATPAEGSKAPYARRIEIGGRAATGSDAANGRGLGAASVRRRATITQERHTGAPAATGERAGAGVSQNADGWRSGGRICHGAMDAAARRQGDCRTLRRAIQHRPSVAFAAAPGLFPPEAGKACHPTQRRGDCSLEAAHLAWAQKKPSARAEQSYS